MLKHYFCETCSLKKNMVGGEIIENKSIKTREKSGFGTAVPFREGDRDMKSEVKLTRFTHEEKVAAIIA